MKNFLKWALIITMINIVLGIVTYLAIGNDTNAWQTGSLAKILNWATWIGGIVCLFLGIKQKKEMDPADFTFGRGWVEGFLISIASGLFIGLWTFILFSYINPEAIDLIRQASFAEMAKTQPQNIEQARGMMELMISPTGFSTLMFLGYTVGGMGLSLIVAAVVNSMGGGQNKSGEMANA